MLTKSTATYFVMVHVVQMVHLAIVTTTQKYVFTYIQAGKLLLKLIDYLQQDCQISWLLYCQAE